MRLIDADALEREGWLLCRTFQKDKDTMIYEVKKPSDFLTIEPERKKGKWLETDAAPHRIYCSNCYKTYIPNKEWVAWKEDIVPKSYCPNCGSEMER